MQTLLKYHFFFVAETNFVMDKVQSLIEEKKGIQWKNFQPFLSLTKQEHQTSIPSFTKFQQIQQGKGQMLMEIQQYLRRPSNPFPGAVALGTSQAHLLQPCLQPRGNITRHQSHRIDLIILVFCSCGCFCFQSTDCPWCIGCGGQEHTTGWHFPRLLLQGKSKETEKAGKSSEGKAASPCWHITSHPTGCLSSATPFNHGPSLAFAHPLASWRSLNAQLYHVQPFHYHVNSIPSHHNFQIF